MLKNLEEFVQAYLTTALWSSNDDNGDPLDDNRDESDIAPDSRTKMEADCAAFYNANLPLMEAAIETDNVKYGPDFGLYGRAGHDFWLTRNGHGAGFWDGDWPEPFATQLSDAARATGMRDLYVGDDGAIHQM